MSRKIGIEAARAKLGDLADAAHYRNEETTLTKQGRPWARIAPLEVPVPHDPATIQAIHSLLNHPHSPPSLIDDCITALADIQDGRLPIWRRLTVPYDTLPDGWGINDAITYHGDHDPGDPTKIAQAVATELIATVPAKDGGLLVRVWVGDAVPDPYTPLIDWFGEDGVRLPQEGDITA